jgi:hypothetical protein
LRSADIALKLIFFTNKPERQMFYRTSHLRRGAVTSISVDRDAVKFHSSQP